MIRVLVILWCLAVSAFAQRVTQPPPGGNPVTPANASPLPDTTALGALALVPKDVATRVARLEGPDGHPFPERWYVLVHDPGLPTGLREYVFAEGKAVANRGLSQFAERVSAEEVIGAAVVKINSNDAAGLAAQFTLHNGQLVGSIRYELAKFDGVPAWRLTCTAPDGQILGTVVVHATSGAVLSSEGFAKSPLQADSSEDSQSATAETEPPVSEVTSERPTRVATKTTKPRPKKRTQTVARRSSQGPIDRVGSFFRKVFR